MSQTIRDIKVDGNLYDISYFFDSETSSDSIDIYRADDGAHIGEMIGMEFPDEHDEEAMENIKKELKDWLDNNI